MTLPKSLVESMGLDKAELLQITKFSRHTLAVREYHGEKAKKSGL